MKIGIVGDDTLDKTDGVEQYILTIGRWLSQQGHEVHYLVGETHRTDLPHVHSLARNIKVRGNGNRLSIPLPAGKARIRQLVQREQFDVLYVQMPYSPFMAERVIRAAGPKTVVVGIFHILPNTRLAEIGTRLLRLALWRSIGRFDALLSVSTAAQEFSKRAFGITTTVIPNASPLDDFFTAKPFPKYQDRLVVLCHGRLVVRKGSQYLLAVVARLCREGLWPEKAIVLISGDGPLRPKLERYVAKHKLKSIVTFLGFTTEHDKPRYMASADVAVFPSTGGESFGIVLLEAMAAGRGAVLAGNNPGYASVMNPREDSLFDPKDQKIFAQKLLDYLTKPTKRKAAHAWQQQYVKRYDVPVVGARLLELFEQALRKRRA